MSFTSRKQTRRANGHLVSTSISSPIHHQPQCLPYVSGHPKRELQLLIPHSGSPLPHPQPHPLRQPKCPKDQTRLPLYCTPRQIRKLYLNDSYPPRRDRNSGFWKRLVYDRKIPLGWKISVENRSGSCLRWRVVGVRLSMAFLRNCRLRISLLLLCSFWAFGNGRAGTEKKDYSRS